MTGSVRIEVSGGVALLTLDRPEKLNSVTTAMSQCKATEMSMTQRVSPAPRRAPAKTRCAESAMR